MVLQRNALLIGLLGIAGLLVVGRFVWRPSREGSAVLTTSTDGSVAARVPSSPPSHATKQAPPARRPFVITRGETKSKAFRTEESGRVRKNEAPVYAKAREAARGAWDGFVREAKPTIEQQQAILSAIYDAQLYRAEVDQVEGEWGTDWAYGDMAQAGPFPDTSWMQDIRDAVWARAAEVLDEKQDKIFRYHCDLAIDLAVQGKLVQPPEDP